MTVTWLIAIAIVFLIVMVAAMVRKDDPFQAAATELGLKLTRTVPDLFPNLDGLVDGIAVKIDVVASRESAIRYTVFYPALGLSLRLERETTITRTLGQLGSADPQVGSKPFDDSFRVNTSRPDALQTMMTPARRRQLVQLIEQYPSVIIEDGSISLLGDSLEPPAETIVTTTRDLVSAAETLVAGRPPALPTPEPVSTPPDPSEATTAQPARGQQQAAASPTAQTMTEIVPTVSEPPLPSSPTTSTGLPPGFFEDVFGANRLSFEDKGRFETEIRGATVTLSGTVKHASASTNDDDKIAKTGTKAVITVAQIDNDLYGKTDIDAVVLLTGVTSSDLNRGDPISFRGTIDAVDAFMRNLVIIDASRTS